MYWLEQNMSYSRNNFLGYKSSCECELVDAISVWWSIQEVRERPEALYNWWVYPTWCTYQEFGGQLFLSVRVNCSKPLASHLVYGCNQSMKYRWSESTTQIAAFHSENHSKRDEIVVWQVRGAGMSCLTYHRVHTYQALTMYQAPTPLFM